MKRILSVLLLLSANILFAQEIKWNSAPQTGFVFQITNDEAQKLLTKSSPDTIINALLHTQIDTFNVNRGWVNRPGKGHFILVKIIENKLHCEYTSVFPYEVLLLKEYGALSLQVLDLEGHVRADAKVKFKMSRIRFDQQTKTYRIENQLLNASSKIVTVELGGFRSVFNVEKHEVPSWSSDYYHDDERPDFYSYMITDKNKYKPGERLRFKSYALSGSRNPIRRDLEIWLMKPGSFSKIGTVSPHRPGSFAGEIYLHDSLKLTLDRKYTIQLRDKNGRVASSCGFSYEDYELNGNKLSVELETQTQFFPASNHVKITATTENGLLLKDARASIVVRTENIREIFQSVVSLPDTLMYKEITLDPDEASVVEIPSSLFQKSNTSYAVYVSVLNSERQRMEEGTSAVHYFSHYEFKTNFSNDSIVYQMLNNGAPMQNVPVQVYRDDATQGVDMILPHWEKINAAVSTLAFKSEYLSRTIRMADMLPKIEFVGGIEKDSFNISIDNPQKMQVSWYVYQGSILQANGFGTDINFRSKIEDRSQTYYVELLYSFGGTDHIVTKEFAFRNASLDIALNLPERVYPGQKVDAVIEVKDDRGNAVRGVDLTAFATTAKLDYYTPDLPYYGSVSFPRYEKATYSKYDVNKRSAILDLDYEKWAPRARLDTMKYYQFTYPTNKIFFHQYDIADSTQFAAYVMRDGLAKQVYVIEVDRMPVYYSWTDQPKGYSFYAEPEKMKEITLRLYDRVLVLDSMCFDAGKKTILSIDLDHLPKGIVVCKMTPEMVKAGWRRRYAKWVFTETETNRLNQYLAAFAAPDRPTWLTSKKEFVAISTGTNRRSQVIVGPIFSGRQNYVEHNKLKINYRHEGKYAYAFEDNVVYKLQAPMLIPERLYDASFQPMTLVNDMVINEKLLLKKKSIDEEKWYPRVIDLVDYACRVKVMLPLEKELSGVKSLLFQNCKTGTIVSPCRSYLAKPDYFTMPRGLHHAIVLYNNGKYLKLDNIDFQSHSNVVLNMQDQIVHDADSMSAKWLLFVKSDCFGRQPTPSRSFSFTLSRHGAGNVRGIIYDDTNMPMPGANIILKGTTVGAVSDVDGSFTIDVPEDHSILVVAFVGYMMKEIEVSPGAQVSVVMEADVSQLEEVVVTGYTTERKSDLVSAVAMISGRVAGVQVSHEDKQEEIEDEDKPQNESNHGAARKLYQELLTLKNIRSHFSDVAFWEPRLFTDDHGKAAFTITFPDDITRWDAVVYGMNRHLQTGTVRKSIKSYKPLMAELYVPQFLTVGDSVDFVGKVLNYTGDKTIQGKAKWTGTNTLESDVAFGNYHAEKFSVVAASTDSVKTNYTFTRDDGYFDGEERTVPVIQQGTIRANGTLSMLKNNDELHLKAKQGETVKLEIFDNALDLYAGDVQYLIHYTYDCNEQLASKLMGLLNYKLLMQYEDKAFKHDIDINKIIQRLLKNQNSEFLWSWWDVSSNTSYWMSAHILCALKAAKDAGYIVNLDTENLTRKATYKYEFLKHVNISDVNIIHALAIWNAKIDYAKCLSLLDTAIQHEESYAREEAKRYHYVPYSLLKEKLLLLEVRQLQKLPFVRDSLMRYKKQTILNEVYFNDSKRSRHWYTNDLSYNAVAYRIIKHDSTLRDLCTPMQMYFLSLHKKGSWNTYEASNVLMSILPDLIAQGTTKKIPASVSLAGKVNDIVQKFPYKAALREGEELHIHKETGLPLYCMHYTEERVTKAQSGTDAFKINTTFSDKALTAGKPVILKTTVVVKSDAKLEHVMIEIPIPGGCSYADKRQFDNIIETHREYFKERTVIFCENMTAGTYVFQVQLLPRFTGKYHVNPAQVSLMYFPVINANTDMEKVTIKEVK